METVLNFILVYIIPILFISVPIITLISAFIHRNDKKYTEVSYFISKKDNMGTLKQFRSDVKNKSYTKCERNIIIGSDQCRGCCYFKDKIVENEKINGKYTCVVTGIVECNKH